MPVSTEKVDVSFAYFGFDLTAKQKTVKEAYRRYVKEFHPDTFKAGTDEQKMAAEKIVAANQHFEVLKAWFNLPDEERAQRAGTADPKPEPVQEPKNENDWQDWEKARHNVWDKELEDWIKSQKAARTELIVNRASRDRKSLVYGGRAFFAVATVLMWMGYLAMIGPLQAKHQSRVNAIAYQVTHGTQADVQWDLNVVKQDDAWGHYEERYQQIPLRFVYMLMWSGAAGWLLFSKTAKAKLDGFLVGKPQEAV